MKRKRKLATLTPAENKEWVWYFAYYKEQGWTDAAADKHAWADLIARFPRLKEYDRCRP